MSLLFFAACDTDDLTDDTTDPDVEDVEDSVTFVTEAPLQLIRTAGSFTVEVAHSPALTIEITAGDDWLSQSSESTEDDTTLVTFTYGENNSGAEKEAKVEFAAGDASQSFEIVQNYKISEDTRTILNPDAGFYKAMSKNITDDGSSDAYFTEETFTNHLSNQKLFHLRMGLAAFSTNAGGEDKELPANVLASLAATFDNLRAVDASAVIRFSYDVSGTYAENEPDMNLIVTHIGQLGALINEYSDVIAGVESGMFGPWGEQHSTTTAKQGENYYTLVEAWLDAVDNLGVTLRTPSHFLDWLNRKYNFEYTTSDIDTYDYSKVSDPERASRVGCYNDGYLGSTTDLGTFTSYKTRDMEVAWISLAATTTLYGGEVVADSVTGGLGLQNIMSYMEVEAFITKTSYLNIDWNYSAVISKWRSSTYVGDDQVYNNGDYTDFDFARNRLGYRLYLPEYSASYDASSGTLSIDGEIANVGFANVVKPMITQIVVANSTNSYTFDIALDDFDVREILSNSVEDLDFEIDLSAVAAGDYTVYIKFSSIYEKKASNLRTIELANDVSMWDEELGANVLGSVTI